MQDIENFILTPNAIALAEVQPLQEVQLLPQLHSLLYQTERPYRLISYTY